MTSGQFLVVGRSHEARFSEDFDRILDNAIRSTPAPRQAAAELDGVALLTVLANFAGVGPYDPAKPPDQGLSGVLRVDEANPSLRISLDVVARRHADGPVRLHGTNIATGADRCG